MELRGQDKEIGLPGSLGYNPLYRDSSSPVPSVPINSAAGERRRDQSDHGDPLFHASPPQTLDHHPHLFHHHLNPNQNVQNKPRRDPEPDPDPLSASVPAITATRPPTINRSNQKSPPEAPSQQQPLQASPPTIVSTEPVVRYRECLKNHAASMGGHVVDGCGEFMPVGQEGTQEALRCAACECHRNFHRKEIDGESQYAANCHSLFNNPNRNNSQRIMVPPPHLSSPHQQPSLHHHQPHRFSHGLPNSPIAPMMVTFCGGGGGGSGGGPAESSSEDLNMFDSNNKIGQTSGQPTMSKKRFRTKFSQEQKEKMLEFAEKLGWKIQKQNEQEVQQFCSQVNVKRQVFKVWMHNNKQAMKKKQM